MGLGRAVLTLTADGRPLDAELARARGRVRQAVGEMKREFSSSFGSSIFGVIGSSISSFISGLSSTLTSVGSTITRNVTVPVVALGTGILALGADAIKTGADFEKAMSGVGAILGATKDEVKQLRDLAINLGLDPNLIVSASQAAGVMEELAKNGLTTDEILNGAARAAIALANATGVDFSTGAAVASTAMQLFNLEASEMADIVNVITGVANQSRFSVEDFAGAMAMGGGVAASMGIPVEDFATAIAGLSTSFSSGSDAGTSFKVFLQRLAADTKPAIAAMKDLGIITEESGNRFFDAEGNMKSLSEIAGILQEALAGLSDEEKITALHDMFGTDAMRAALGMAELGADGFDKLAEAMAKTDASENAAMRMDNLSGAIEILSGIVEAFKIKFTEAFGPGVRTIVEGFSKFLGTHSGEIDNLIKMLASVFDGFAKAMVEGINQNGPIFLEFFRKLIVSLPLVFDKLRELGATGAPYLNRLFEAFKNITPEQIAKIIETILGLAAAGPVLMALGQALVPILIALGVQLVQIIKEHGPEIKKFFSDLGEKMPDLIGKLKEIGTVAGPQVQKLVDAFMAMPPEKIVKLIELIGALVIFAKVAGVLGSIGTFFTGLASIGTILSGLGGIATLFSTLGTVFASVGALLTGGILLPLLVIIGTVALVYLAFKNNFMGITDTVMQLGWLIGYYMVLAFEKIKAAFNNLKTTLSQGWALVKADAANVWGSITESLKGKADGILENIKKLVIDIKEAFNIDWRELGQRIIDGIVGGLMGGVNAVVDAATAVAQAALDAAADLLGIESPSKAFAKLGDFSGIGFTQGLQKSLAPQKVSGIMSRAVAGAVQTVNNARTNNINVYNPAPEPASSSVERTMRKLSYLGVDR